MKNFIISTEAACDISETLIEKYDIRIVPMKYIVNNVEFQSNDKNFSTAQVCKFMKEGATTKTTQITELDAQEHFEKLLVEGKDILHLSFSGAMSSTAENFKRAASKLNENSKNKIYTLDTLCQSGGLGLIVDMVASQSEKNNLTAKQAYEYADSVKLNIAHFFTVDDLKYLARGGRISSSAALIGNIIKIKPVLHLNNDGVIEQHQKVISRKKALSVLINRTIENWNKQYNTIFISHADAQIDAEYIASTIKQNYDVNIEIVPLCPVVCNHSGPGTIAIFFTSNSR